MDLRGRQYGGRTIQAKEPSLFRHLVKRVLGENQWPLGTSVGRYLEDLHRAVRAPSARLVLYEARGGHIAATLTPARDVLSPGELGIDALPLLLVVYSADRGTIINGYQASDLTLVRIPGDGRWLR